MNDWADTHLAADFDGQDWDDREQDDQTAWMDEYEYDYAALEDEAAWAERELGGEDSFLDSYWENEAEMAFWDE